MKIAVLFSGGKDSTLTIFRAIRQGMKVKYLISLESENPDSYMFHYPNIGLTALQAQSMGIPLLRCRTKGEKEKELKDLEKAIGKAEGIEAVGAGALGSRYQFERVKSVCASLGLEAYAPLWGLDPEKEWQELLSNSFQVMITAVACEGLGREWLGETIDQERFRELRRLSERHRFHLGFEGGEAETFVTDCPLFTRRIRISKAEKRWNRETASGTFNIIGAALEGK